MKVPTITEPSVSSIPLREPEIRINAGPESFGAAIGQGLGVVSRELGQVGLEIKRKQDSRKVLELTGIATEANNSVVAKIKQKKMKEVEGLEPIAQALLEKNMAAALAGAENETQKLLIEETLRRQSSAIMQTVREHEIIELDKYDQFSADQLNEKSKDMVKTDPMNFQLVQTAEDQAAAAMGKRWEGKVSPDELKQIRAAAASGVRASQLEALLAQGKDEAFLTMYPQVKDKLVGADADKFAKIATNTSDLNVEQALTEVFFTENPENETAALARARASLEGKREENVIQALKVRYAEIRSAAKEVQSADLDEIGRIYNESGYSLKGVPGDLFARVNAHNPDVIRALRDHELQAANRSATVKTDPVSWSRWYRLTDAQKLDPKNDPLNWVNVWNEADFQKAVAIVADIKAERSGFKKQKPTYTQADINRIVTGEFTRAYGGTTGDDAAKFKIFQDIVTRRIEHYQVANNGAVPPLEGPNSIAAYVAYALAEGARAGGWRGVVGMKSPRRFMAEEKGLPFQPNDPNQPQQDPLEVSVVVPDEDAAAIADALEAAGKPVTQEAILRIWRKSQENKK
jgi:hypothetical protein